MSYVDNEVDSTDFLRRYFKIAPIYELDKLRGFVYGP